MQLSAVRYQGLDTVGHYNLRYTQPRDIGESTDDERRRRLQVIDRYYSYIDSEIGEALAGLLPGDLLLVVSGFGMEAPRAVKRTVARVLGDPMSGTHERAPDGFLLAYGTVGRARPSSARLDRRRRPRPCCTSSACQSAATWTATRDWTCSSSAFTTGRPIAFVPTHNR